MPQKAAGRKVAFSGKKKKLQMKEKRKGKTPLANLGGGGDDSDRDDVRIQKINDMGNPGGRNTRYALQFKSQSKSELEEMKKRAREPYEFHGDEALYLDKDAVVIDMPKRPHWEDGWSRERLDMSENKYFREYTSALLAENADLSYFEMNLETWRQLWRVLEMSDIILLIADTRYPLIHIPVALQRHVKELGKRLIIVLNKIDLVDAELTARWTKYLEKAYPGTKVVPFASYAGCKMIGKGRRGKMRSPLQSCLALVDAVKGMMKEEGIAIDLGSWEKKIREDAEDRDEDQGIEVENVTEQEAHGYEKSGIGKGILTLGMVGHPNVGKSSLLNALMGKKVVSVSRTPGHTKHFQTIFLTKNLRLCDCPGLVFPTNHPRELQVISGSYPVAQLRVPLAAIQYVCERIHVERVLRLPKIETDEGWSAFEICESWAQKRGFLTAKTGRPDVNRAANQILRMALDGRTVCVAFKPPKDEVIIVDPKFVQKVKEISGGKPEPLVSDDENSQEGASDASSDATDADQSGSSSDEDGGLIAAANQFAALMPPE